MRSVTPATRSRTKTFVVALRRRARGFVASDLNATYRPSSLIAVLVAMPSTLLSPSPSTPLRPRLTRSTVPVRGHGRKTSPTLFASPVTRLDADDAKQTTRRRASCRGTADARVTQITPESDVRRTWPVDARGAGRG